MYVDDGFAIMRARTIARRYGWVYFYQSRRFIETNDIRYAVAGNGPIVVLAENGELLELESGRPVEAERSPRFFSFADITILSIASSARRRAVDPADGHRQLSRHIDDSTGRAVAHSTV
jgi:hypothetical protein